MTETEEALIKELTATLNLITARFILLKESHDRLLKAATAATPWVPTHIYHILNAAIASIEEPAS